MQLTPSSLNKKGKHFLKTTQPNNLAKAEKMPPRKLRKKTREPKLHKLADKLTEILICFMVIFSAWAFGTTEPWSIWTMNITAYALGILLVTKWITRLATKYNPNPEPDKNELSPKQKRLRLIQKTCTILLAGSMFLLLAYILTSAINARASFNFDTREYTYFDGVNKNFPHSYDASGTWFLFWQYLGLIILFWSTRDWLAGGNYKKYSISINLRLRRLLLLLCFNGAALALECILQRIYFGDYQGKLIFLIEPVINRENLLQFGPFSYRSNAASYLNLIWPIALGLFLQLCKENLEVRKLPIGNGKELLLIPCVIICATTPIISASRGGAIISILLLFITLILMLFIKTRSNFLGFCHAFVLLGGLGMAYYFGWDKLASRLNNILIDELSGRTIIYDKSLKMIEEYGYYGSGPGSFETIFQFEVDEAVNSWASWAHNDYLEFYLTFGIIGFSIMCCVFILLIFKAALNFFYYTIQKLLTFFVGLSLFGVFTHAAGDFPLQTHSILILICILGAIFTKDYRKYYININ